LTSTLGVTQTRSAQNGHKIVIESDEAIQNLSQTETPEMVSGLLSHCLKVLKPNEASDEYEGNDERAFMLAAVKEIAASIGALYCGNLSSYFARYMVS
jgi:hypothetical protein